MSEDPRQWALFSASGNTAVETAAAVSTLFDSSRLTQARVLSGLTKREVADAVGVSSSAIGQYEAKIAAPRPEVLVELGRVLGQDLAFFAGGRPYVRVDTGDAHFRSLRSMRAADRDRALATVEQIWELTCALEQHIQLPNVDLPTLAPGVTPAEAAHETRRQWGLPHGPIRHLVATMEAHGLVVILAKDAGHIDRVDAFSTVVGERPIVISTPRRSHDVYRHRFTCAHELGHILLHRDQTSGDLALERQADEFAAELLTPTREMRTLLPQRMDLSRLDLLGRTWGVSVNSLILRMRELRVVSAATVRRAYIRLNSVQSLAPEQSVHSYRGETPRMLRDAVNLADTIGIGLGQLAHDLRWETSRIRDLLGVDDPRPVLTIVP